MLPTGNYWPLLSISCCYHNWKPSAFLPRDAMLARY